MSFKSGSDFEASFTFIDDVTNVIEKMIKMQKFKFSTYHFGSGKNNKLIEIINFINKNYKDKKVISGPGYAPWSNDSVIRGPMITSNKINFFNKTALTTTLPAQLSIKYNLDIVPVYIERDKKNNFIIEFKDRINPKNYNDKIELTKKLNDTLEKMIIRNPSQWIWTHNRWK